MLYNGVTIVFELANNHQGYVDHAKEILHSINAAAEKFKIRKIAKFQFRNLSSFIRIDTDNSDNKHISRFVETELDLNEFEEIFEFARSLKFEIMVTPFDEQSVAHAVQLGADYLKIASCSSTDWPLIDLVADQGLPVIFSTGGARIENVRRLVSLFEHKNVDFAFMHCVSLYPTATDQCLLDLYEEYKREFPFVNVGWSTHEDPNNLIPACVAASKGINIFEKHVGLATNSVSLNNYSIDVNGLTDWLQAIFEARSACNIEAFEEIRELERPQLETLMRTGIAKRAISTGEVVTVADVEFRFPLRKGEYSTEVFSKHNIITATTNIELGQSISEDNVLVERKSSFHMSELIQAYKAIVNTSRVVLPNDFKLEISHHDGIENGHKVGAALIDVVNKDYCKKLLIMLPGQSHPEHKHVKKQETFFVLWGDLEVTLNGEIIRLDVGDLLTVSRESFHSFKSINGCVFEEISTRAISGDSFYSDETIDQLQLTDRKSWFAGWGRFQFD